MFARLKEDVDAIMDRDPAARSRLEVVLCYPGLHAVAAYRLSHWCWGKNFRLLARMISHTAKVFTGVEIHPGATIGRRVFIDHATGVVIGETAEVGDDCTLYQGVTLGGTSLEKGKRHPTLETGVIVGSGAQILGPHTIGAGARVGANAVVLGDVPPGVTVVGIPAREVLREAPRPQKELARDFCAYGMPKDDLPDPVARALEVLSDQVCTLSKRVVDLEGQLVEARWQARKVEGALPRLVEPSGSEEPAQTTKTDGEEAPPPPAATGTFS